MRNLLLTGLALAALALTGAASPATAQPLRPPSGAPSGAPAGSYLQQCSKVQMNGLFLSAICRGAHGSGQSSINVASCRGDIGVDATGALACAGAGAAVLPSVNSGSSVNAGLGEGRGRGAARGGEARADGGPPITLFGARGFRGEPVRLEGPTPDLAAYGLNDRVRSIGLEPGSGPWMVCSDAGYRGRCITVDHSVGDTRAIGMDGVISSLRPLQ